MYFYLSKILAPFLNLANLFLFILLFYFIKNYKLNTSYRTIKVLIFIIFFLISFLPVGNLGLNYLEKNFFFKKDPVGVDKIIVLAGSEDIVSTKITNKLNLNDDSERLIYSVKLALDNPNSIIYFLGGDGNLVKDEIDETFVAKLFYKDIGFNLDRVKFFNKTRNTAENLKLFKKYHNSDETTVLITSAFHMKRSMLIAKELGLKLYPYPVDFKSFNYSSIINYYQRFSVARNWVKFNLFFREIIGILAFKVFY